MKSSYSNQILDHFTIVNYDTFMKDKEIFTCQLCQNIINNPFVDL